MPRISPFGRSLLNKMVRALLVAEWKINGYGTRTCVACGNWTFGPHTRKDCPVDEALKAAGYADEGARESARFRIRMRAMQDCDRARSQKR